ncbi:hypothetical protein EVAR_65290_1 [Eumeta japonica]|uniref:Uncharacterized protein n=1 Tax=Eumeta variegata TaxID=151549 RepID=A0A4C1ZRJ8_EUMVA|nr:hypothetical protein EVAR_65290_1 [Eumeta japonica]
MDLNPPALTLCGARGAKDRRHRHGDDIVLTHTEARSVILRSPDYLCAKITPIGHLERRICSRHSLFLIVDNIRARGPPWRLKPWAWAHPARA